MTMKQPCQRVGDRVCVTCVGAELISDLLREVGRAYGPPKKLRAQLQAGLGGSCGGRVPQTMQVRTAWNGRRTTEQIRRP